MVGGNHNPPVVSLDQTKQTKKTTLINDNNLGDIYPILTNI